MDTPEKQAESASPNAPADAPASGVEISPASTQAAPSPEGAPAPQADSSGVPSLDAAYASPSAQARPAKKKAKSGRLGDRVSAIDMKNVVKHFGPTIAVNDVSLEVPEGCVFGLIGPNGAGKTTTFSMLAGYLMPTSGEIFMLDHLPTSVNELRGQVGVLPQDAMLPAGEKVGSFLMYLAQLQGMRFADAKVAVEQVLTEVEGRDWWNTRCGALSHGMAKRVGLAQALLGSPRIILLDEPTAGLDPRVAYGVRQIVKSRKGRSTLVISSHNLQELEEICDRAAILDRGVVVAHGTMAELTASSSEIRVELATGPVPLDQVRTIQGVTSAGWEKGSREMNITFDRRVADAEEMIRRVTYVLYQHQARISGISKGRGLEQRVMELTE